LTSRLSSTLAVNYTHEEAKEEVNRYFKSSHYRKYAGIEHDSSS
jgi:hypothetical protein